MVITVEGEATCNAMAAKHADIRASQLVQTGRHCIAILACSALLLVASVVATVYRQLLDDKQYSSSDKRMRIGVLRTLIFVHIVTNTQPRPAHGNYGSSAFAAEPVQESKQLVKCVTTIRRHGWALSDVVLTSPAVTRFVYDFIMVERLLQREENVRKLIGSRVFQDRY
eukprot:9604-Heterococcus_DN1.PRE.13